MARDCQENPCYQHDDDDDNDDWFGHDGVKKWHMKFFEGQFSLLLLFVCLFVMTRWASSLIAIFSHQNLI